MTEEGNEKTKESSQLIVVLLYKKSEGVLALEKELPPPLWEERDIEAMKVKNKQSPNISQKVHQFLVH